MRILAAILLLGNVQFVGGQGLEVDVKGNNGSVLSWTIGAIREVKLSWRIQVRIQILQKNYEISLY